MITMPSAYKPYANSRKCNMNVVFELIDVSASELATTSATDECGISQKEQTHNRDTEISKKYATLENDYWMLDGTFILPDENTLSEEETGWWSEELSSSSGSFSTQPALEFKWEENHSSVGFVIYFDSTANEYPSRIRVRAYNACYKRGLTMKPKGIMVHSTAANNPYLKRYVGPNDGLLGENKNGNHWNTNTPDGRKVCVHAFIGKLTDGTIATYQTLPWNYCGWHAGGSANNNYIGFEICEDGLTDRSYFDKVYKEAVELCVFLCRQYGLSEKSIICHSEGYKKGIASNHADVMHWFPKHGKSMDTFRADVKALLREEVKSKMDNTPNAWSKEAVDWMIKNNLLSGNENGDLMLRSPLTREQLCVILKNYHDTFSK